MSRMMVVDIETYSDIDIKKAGLYRYAESPAFDILLIAWCMDRGPVQLVDLTCDPGAEGAGRNWLALQDFFRDFYAIDTVRYAYNAAFEHFCLNTWLRRQGRPTLQPGDWKCIQAHGLYLGYPASLAAVGEAMGLPADKRKMGIGAALIRKFCVPQKANRSHPAPWRMKPADDPEKWALFCEYCRQDVATERVIEQRLSPWPLPAREQLLWEATVEGNCLGVGVDRALVAGAIALGAQEQERMTEEARAISGLQNPKSVQQLMKWLNEELETEDGNEITDLRKGTVAELLKDGVDSAKAGRMLELRQQMSKTSTKKYDALEAAVCDDGRVRGMMFYYGAARTGRWAGRIVQPQNLPQNHLDGLDFARECVKKRDGEMIKLCWGSVPDTLSQLIRTAFVPRRGKVFAVADYSAIEARVVAWLAGEEWVLQAFRDGKDIYCATASQMFGVPVEKHGENAHLRQRGKVATLALGYGGGEGALEAMGALKMGIPKEDLAEIKMKWRNANPNICRFWRRMEDAACRCVATGTKQSVAILGKGALVFALEGDDLIRPAFGGPPSPEGKADLIRPSGTFPRGEGMGQKFLTIALPSGRKLFYAQPFLAPAKNFPERQSLHYYQTDQTSRKWGVADTWGGKLTENVTQAVARDCLAETLLALRRRVAPAVFHVHDEVIVEAEGEEDLETILDIMDTEPEWAPGLPLKGAGFVCGYYQKD